MTILIFQSMSTLTSSFLTVTWWYLVSSQLTVIQVFAIFRLCNIRWGDYKSSINVLRSCISFPLSIGKLARPLYSKYEKANKENLPSAWSQLEIHRIKSAKKTPDILHHDSFTSGQHVFLYFNPAVVRKCVLVKKEGRSVVWVQIDITDFM